MTEGPTLVLAPHPDDEVLGAGGTIARRSAAGEDVHVVIVTTAGPPVFDESVVEVGRAEAAAAHEFLGVASTKYLDFPAAGLDRVFHRELNGAIASVVAELRPVTVLVPFISDLHRDHQEIFHSAMVACRPLGPESPREILAYETLSETNWNAPYLTPAFAPNVFVDISNHLDRKLDAMRCFDSQVRAFPSERSIESLTALARLRGSAVTVAAAEAFVLIRSVRDYLVPRGRVD